MALLVHLAQRAPATVGRSELLASHWPRHVSHNALDRAVSKLRRALAEVQPGAETWIETVPRAGYRLTVRPAADVEEPLRADPATPDLGPPAEEPPADSRSARRKAGLGVGVAAAALLGAALFLASALDRGTRAGDGSSAGPAPAPEAGRPGFDPDRARPLTSLPGYETSPDVSPDGRRVVFGHYRKEGEAPRQWDLWQLDLPDLAPRPLTTTPEHEIEPRFAPDGRRLAFVRFGESACEVRLLDLREGVERMVGPCGPPDWRIGAVWPRLEWLPDGDLVIADRSRLDEPQRLYRLDPESGRRSQLTRPPGDGAGDSWMARPRPDGRIVFARARVGDRSDLVELRLADGIERRLPPEPRPVAGLAVSPQGDLVVGTRHHGPWRLTVFPASGAAPWIVPAPGRNVTGPRFTPDGELLAEEWRSRIDLRTIDVATGSTSVHEASSRWDWRPARSPDGRELAFLSDRSGPTRVWVRSGAEPARAIGPALGNAPRLAWSPDGSRLVLDLLVGDDLELHLLDPRTGALDRLTRDASDDLGAAFSPDGEWIYFVSDREQGWQVWRLRVADRRPERVTRDGGVAVDPDPSGEGIWLVRPDRPGLWWLDPVRGEPAIRVADDLAPADRAAFAAIERGAVYLCRSADGRARLCRVLREGLPEVLADLDDPGRDDAEAWGESGLVWDARREEVLLAMVTRSESDLWRIPATGSGQPTTGKGLR